MDRLALALILASAMITLLASSAVLAAPATAASTPEVDSCAGIISSLTPCLDYIKKKVNKPSKQCCDGAKKLNDQAKTKEERQAACNCIKQALGLAGDVDPARVMDLPEQCGIPAKLPPIDRNFDCASISGAFAGLFN